LAGGLDVRPLRYQRALQDKKQQGKSVHDQGVLSVKEINSHGWTDSASPDRLRPKLVNADSPTAGGRIVVQVEDPTHVGGEVRVVAGFHVFGVCQVTPRSCKIRRTVSILIVLTWRAPIR
jgi:hypothetical protein